MIAIDTNILVYSVRQEMPYHEGAVKLIASLAEKGDPWAIPWPCVYEFIRVVTHPRVFSPPSTLATTLSSLEQLRESPSLVMMGDGPGHLLHLLKTFRDSGAIGSLVHDAHIAALCLEHGVSEFYTMDRDFSRFPALRVVRPFQSQS